MIGLQIGETFGNSGACSRSAPATGKVTLGMSLPEPRWPDRAPVHAPLFGEKNLLLALLPQDSASLAGVRLNRSHSPPSIIRLFSLCLNRAAWLPTVPVFVLLIFIPVHLAKITHFGCGKIPAYLSTLYDCKSKCVLVTWSLARFFL
jgi:hypothetical protein